MKFLCPACERIAEIGGFRVEDGTLLLRCAPCGVESRQPEAPLRTERPRPKVVPLSPPPASVEAPAPEAPGTPGTPLAAVDFAVPPDRCPKCIARIPSGAVSCTQCGLAFAHALLDEYGPSEELGARWQELANRWDQPKAHDAVLLTAATLGELAACGRLYRIRLARAPNDPLAQRGLQEVLRLASVPAIQPTAARPSPSMPRWQLWAAGALGVAMLVMIAVLIRILQSP